MLDFFLHIVRKEVTKTLKHLMELGKKQELAATKIQAAFRGYQARKLHNMKTRITDKYISFKGSRPKTKDMMPPNRLSVNVSMFCYYYKWN
jgi:hypothetical protein